MKSKRAVKRILELRNSPSLRKQIEKSQNQLKQQKKCPYKKRCVFVKPNLNFDCNDYTEITNWAVEAVFEPPYVKTLSNEDVQSFIENRLELDFSSHSIQVERAI